MASVLSLLANLTPPPPIVPADYDGVQFRWMGVFVFRPALFKAEACVLVAFVAYVAWALLGAANNRNRIERWFSAHRPILEEQFSKPYSRSTLLVRDGRSDAYCFSTGRRNVTTLHTVFTMKPRHDFAQTLYQYAWTWIDLHYRPRDNVTLDFRLAAGALNHDFVWGIVHKDELPSIKQDRWDLTFTRTSECTTLPGYLSVMTEFADVNQMMLKTSLIAALHHPKILPFFRSLTISDQPRVRPDGPLPTESQHKHLTLSLSLPSSGDGSETVELVSALFPYIDALCYLSLQPETVSKLKKVREDLKKSLEADAEKERKEIIAKALEDKKVAKRRAQEENVAKLPAAEQQKVLEKERKRMLRKSRGRTLVRK